MRNGNGGRAARNAAAILPRNTVPATGILGKSNFVLPASVPLNTTLKPLEATKEESGKGTEKDDTFVAEPEKHPLQVPDEELDELFNDAPPEGTDNEPMDIDVSLDYEDEDEETAGCSEPGAMASGVSFEDMCAAVKVLGKAKETVSRTGGKGSRTDIDGTATYGHVRATGRQPPATGGEGDGTDQPAHGELPSGTGG